MLMKIILTSVFLIAANFIFAQANRIVGIWLTEDKNSQVEIFRSASGSYSGKLVWLEEPLDENGQIKRDTENPDRNLRNRPLKGLLLLEGFQYDDRSKEWTDGTIYDPESGRNYSAYMWFGNNNNTLNLKGFVMGMRFLGRSTTWTRDTRVRE